MASLVGSYHTDRIGRTNTHVRTVRTYKYIKTKATQENSVEAQEHAKDCRLSSVTVYPFSSRDSLKPLAGAICARMLFGLTDLLHVSVPFFNTEHGKEREKKRWVPRRVRDGAFFAWSARERLVESRGHNDGVRSSTAYLLSNDPL